VLVRQLTRKFGPLPESTEAAIRAASLEQLEVWTDRVRAPPRSTRFSAECCLGGGEATST
jgi:hypothetical protein